MKDRYLGLLRLTLIAAIFIYIVIKVLLLDKGYNKHEIPMGTVRSSLQMRDLDGPDGPTASHDIKLWEYPFCPQYNGTDTPWWEQYPQERYACQVWDENLVRYPSEEINAAFITTRVDVTEQRYNCGQKNEHPEDNNETHCADPFTKTDSRIIYLAGTENYTIGISHQFQASVLASLHPRNPNYAGASSALNGRLIDLDGRTLMEFKVPRGKVAKDTPDIMRTSDLLRAADVNLRNPTPGDKDGHSDFYNGIVVMVLIKYSNVDGPTTYTYSVQKIPNAAYKVFEVRSASRDTDSDRTILKRAGVKFIFTVTGDIVAFDFQTLLVQAVSAMGLLSIATLLVELIMLYVLPLREYYGKVKFEETEDFSDFRDRIRAENEANAVNVAELNQQLQNLREHGSTDYQLFSDSTMSVNK